MSVSYTHLDGYKRQQYNDAGKNTLAKLQKGTSGIYIQSTATYTTDGNHLATTNDINNITSTYALSLIHI